MQDIGTDLFDGAVIRALRNSSNGFLSIGDLRKAAHFRRGIFDHLQDMVARGLVSYEPDGATMDSVVRLTDLAPRLDEREAT